MNKLLFRNFNVPDSAATTNQIVASANVVATGTYTIAAQPTFPRTLTFAITDTTPSITAGTLTITGTDQNNDVISQAFDLSAALTGTTTNRFKTVTSVATAGVATLGGGGDETIIVGESAISYIYGVFSDPIAAKKFLKTSGSSTTVSELNTGDASFAPLNKYDQIIVVPGADAAAEVRYVATKTSSASVVVDSAVDWSNGGSGRAFSYRRWFGGTATTDGAINRSGYKDFVISYEWATKNATSLDVIIEGRVDGGSWATLFSANYTAVTVVSRVVSAQSDEVRLGVKVNTPTGTNTFHAEAAGYGYAQRN